ncbi:hypothetical protein J2754_002641 [Halarchaeum solikamskense]|nr:hypothetical protein [Halarchaeum solikamskense]
MTGTHALARSPTAVSDGVLPRVAKRARTGTGSLRA